MDYIGDSRKSDNRVGTIKTLCYVIIYFCIETIRC
jgi:hypothetical protein